MTTKQRLHEIIEQLPEEALTGAERYLTDPTLWWMFYAPEGEPPLSKEEIAGILIGKQQIAEGRYHDFDNVEDAIRWFKEGPPPADD